MSEWSMDELQDWDRKICALGEALDLDWYPIDYEICLYWIANALSTLVIWKII